MNLLILEEKSEGKAVYVSGKLKGKSVMEDRLFNVSKEPLLNLSAYILEINGICTATTQITYYALHKQKIQKHIFCSFQYYESNTKAYKDQFACENTGQGSFKSL